MTHVDLESLIKKLDGSKKLSTTKLSEHISCGYSISTIRTFDGVEKKHDVYRAEDCIRKFVNP